MDNTGHEGAAVPFFSYSHAPSLDSWHSPSCMAEEKGGISQQGMAGQMEAKPVPV